VAEPTALNAWPGLRLWLCPLHEAPTQTQQGWLDTVELARAARFMYDIRRRRYLAAHVALRGLLGAALEQAPHLLRIEPDEHDKPQLVGHAGWQFNLSDSDDWALVGLQQGAPLGVDVEVRRTLDDARALAERLYTPAERAAVLDMPAGPEREAVFLRVWTRKEACLKAVGLGLRLAPSSFEAGAQEAPVVAHLATPAGTMAVEVVSVPTGIDAFAAVARVLGSA
jgi:4'-phosphopantetheinyl transferase